jgi:hypothetical protein
VTDLPWPQLSVFTLNWTDSVPLGVTRGVQLVEPPETLIAAHEDLGARLRKDFEQVFLLTIANTGKRATTG